MLPLLLTLTLSTTLSAPAHAGPTAPPAAEPPSPAVVARADVLQRAAEAELARAMGMQLPDQPPPYFVSYEILDGQVATAEAALGAMLGVDDSPYRMLRTEVRVGDYALDNGNFEGDFGEGSGTRNRLLPHEDVELALRREIWLATDTAYKGATEQLSSKLSAREGSKREFGPDLYPADPVRTPFPATLPDADGEAMQEIVRALSARLVGHGFEDGSAVARDWQGVRMIVNSEGTRAWLPAGFTVVRVEAIGRAEDGARLRDVRSFVARTPAGLPPMEEMVAEVDEMVAWIEALRTAPVEQDYLGPVLFTEPASRELFRQLLAPELAGTPAVERPPEGFDGMVEVLPTARVGRRLLPEGWSVVDDPLEALQAGLPGGYAHDHEAVPAERVEIVQDGVVRDLIMSRVPRKGFDGSTGHGRSLGGDRRVAVSAAVTVTPAKPRSTRRLEKKGLALARQTVQPYVLVVDRIEPPAVSDDFRIAFSGEAPLPGLTPPNRAWRLYPDGHTEPVRGLGFVGVDRRVLRDIVLAGRTGEPGGVMDAAAGSQRFGIGAVGGLPASWAVPPVLISELELHGSGGSEERVLTAPPEDASAKP